MLTAEAIHRARDLEKKKLEFTAELERLQQESFPPPAEPSYSFTPKEHPPIKTPTDWKLALGPVAAAFALLMLCTGLMIIEGGRGLFSMMASILLKLTPLAAIWAIVYFAFINKKRKAEQRTQIEQSVEYRSQCAAVDAENQAAEAQAKQAYDDYKRRYEEELLPRFQAEKPVWEKKHSEDIGSAQKMLGEIDAELEKLYAGDAAVDADLRNATSLDNICSAMDSPTYKDDPAKAILACREEQARIETERAQQAQLEYEQRLYEQQLYDDNREEPRHGFLASTLSTTIGTSLGTRGTQKELRKQTRIMEEEQKARIQREIDEEHRRIREEVKAMHRRAEANKNAGRRAQNRRRH